MGLFKGDYQYVSKIDGMYDNGGLAGIIISLVLHSLAGIGLLGLSVWMYIDTSSYLATYDDKFFICIYILMGVGGVMTLTGFLGCCGAMQESSCMLGTFSTFALVIFAAEIAGAVYGYSNQDEVQKVVSEQVADMIKTGYNVQTAVTMAVDKMNQKFECCGAISINDWSDSTYNNKTPPPTGSFKVPPSCCVSPGTDACEKATTVTSADKASSELYTDGCLEKIQAAIRIDLKIIMIVGICIAVVQIFGFVFSVVLCCAVSGKDY